MIFHKFVRGDPEPEHAWFSKPERILTLEEAVRKMTSYPAETFKISGRGIIRKGMYADITIFDENKISSKATIYNTDVYPVGIPYVIVNGEIVKDNDKHTGALAGKILRWKPKSRSHVARTGSHRRVRQ
jgi:N-acyl-D-aspartate/D-glutamate deacylase